MTSLIGSRHAEIGAYNDQQASPLCVKAAVNVRVIYFLIKNEKESVLFFVSACVFCTDKRTDKTHLGRRWYAGTKRRTLRTLNDDKVPLRRIFFSDVSRM